MSSTYTVGVVIGSQRAVRICPQVAQFVFDIVKSRPQAPSDAQIDLTLIDIASYDLPLTDEPGMPAAIKDHPDGYATDKTKIWSAAVSAIDAFVFVTPQYNWGMPAGLKNALDHLFNEWKGKPAMVVAYGGHGGTLSASALITVLSGMFMRVVKKPICMNYPDRAFVPYAAQGKPLGLDATKSDALWAEHRDEISRAFEEVVRLLKAGRSDPSIRSDGLKALWIETIDPAYQVELKMKSGGGAK